VASQPETLSLQSTRKSYSGASNVGPNASRKEDETRSGTYSDARAQGASPSTEKDYEDEDLETDLRESRAFDDVIVGEQEVSEQDGVATDAPLSDVRSDQPTSSQEKYREEVQPTEPSLQEVLVEITGSRPEEHAMGTDIPASTNVHDAEEPVIQEGEMQFDDMNTPLPESDVSLDEDWPTLPSTTIDCPTVSKPARNGRISQKSPNERPRPARTASRPPRYRDSSFETHFQPVPRRHCRKIQKQKLTGHDNINVGGYLKLGRGENNKKVIPTGNGNNRRLYPHEDKSKIKSTTSPYPPMDTKNLESSIKTLPAHQKHSRTAHLQFKSIARSRASTDHRSAASRGSEAAEIVISVPPAARRRARASSADARLITTSIASNRRAATISIDKVKADVSGNKNAESISVSVDREMQTADDSSSEIFVHSEPYKFHLQQQNPQINTADVQTSLESANSANKCRVIDNASTEKIKIAETTASAETCENKVHKHRFRRKKRQKSRRNCQGE